MSSKNTKECPDCQGEGKYVGLDEVEDPCQTCGGSGEIIIETESSDEDEDGKEAEEAAKEVFEVDESDYDDFAPFANYLEDLDMYTKVDHATRQCSQSLLMIRDTNVKGLPTCDLSRNFVVDVIPNGGSFQNAESCIIPWKEWERAAEVVPSDVEDMMNSSQGREMLMDFFMYRDHTRIISTYSDAIQKVEEYLHLRRGHD